MMIHLEPISPALEAHLVEICAEELWDGVYCTKEPGHTGSHESSASDGGCSFTWSSHAHNGHSTATGNDRKQLDSFLRLMRTGSLR